jgi:hypothetical protein
MKLIPVKAAPGLKVPKEGEPHKYITEGAPVQVPATHYYNKAIADRDLIELSAAQWGEHKAAFDKAEAAAARAAKAAKTPA